MLTPFAEGRECRDRLRLEAVPLPDQLDLEHRLQEGVIVLADGVVPLRPLERMALQPAHHPVHVGPAVRRLDRPCDHLRRHEAVGVEEVGHLVRPFRPDALHERLVDLVLRRLVDVVRQEGDPLRRRAEDRVGGSLVEPGDDRGGGEHPLAIERAPHRRCGRAGPGDEEEVGLAVQHLLGERSEVARVVRHQQLVDVRAARAENRLHRRHIPLPERGVGREDEDILAAWLPQERLGGEDVLVGLTPGSEGIAVDPGERIDRRRPADEEDPVLLRQRRDLQRHAGDDRPGKDLEPLADQVARRGDARVDHPGVVADHRLDAVAIDHAGPARDVVEADLEPFQVLLAVRLERAAAGGNDSYPDGAPDRPRRRRGPARRGLRARRGGRRRAGSGRPHRRDGGRHTRPARPHSGRRCARGGRCGTTGRGGGGPGWRGRGDRRRGRRGRRAAAGGEERRRPQACGGAKKRAP